MKFLTPLALSATAIAAVIPQQAPLGPSIVQNSQQTKWLIELAPYQTRWVTEEEKWALKLVSLK
jgi:bacterial leucyl aminopeptidase